jgi:hypothetical protein
MSEPNAHSLFERQIERIHQLLESDDAQITWDDRIPDPDFPSQPRQIDITIRRDNSLTLVECRIHKAPQDVTWIEELMGRRDSLNADGVIAVSASGFTSTAKAKAKHHGIVLRDLAALSQLEVQNWGKKRLLILNFLEINEMTVTFWTFHDTFWRKPVLTNNEGGPIDPITWRLLIQDIAHRLDDQKWTGQPCTVDMVFAVGIKVNGFTPCSMRLKAKVRRVSEKVLLAAVLVYTDPSNNISHAEVGKFSLGSSEIIENQNDKLSVIIDLSTIKTPADCVFETVLLDAGRLVTANLSFVGEKGAIAACNCSVVFRTEFITAYPATFTPSASLRGIGSDA